jgi:uncharacterized protein DUF6152
MRRETLVLFAILLVGASASAHHSHPAFLLDQSVSIEGELTELTYGNPHVVMKLRAADGTVYTAEWQGATWFERRAMDDRRTDKRYDKRPFTLMTGTTLRIGDRLVVTGSPHRDPTVHELVVLKEVRRPHDGWIWRG